MQYTVRFKYATGKMNPPKKGMAPGSHGTGEIDISVSGPFDKTNLLNKQLIDGCKHALRQNEGIKGVIVSLEITEIVEKAS
jgi:hypothetical protein